MLSKENAETLIRKRLDESSLDKQYHRLIKQEHIQKAIDLNGQFRVVILYRDGEEIVTNEELQSEWMEIEDCLIDSSRRLGTKAEADMRNRQAEIMKLLPIAIEIRL